MNYYSDDVRQMAWDSILIRGWHSDSKMHILWDMYKIDHPHVDFRLLRRSPRVWELRSSVKVFVARYIPKLSEKLWNEDKDIMFWLMMKGDTCDRQNGPADKWAERADKRERVQSNNNVRSTTKRRRAMTKLFETHRRSNQWFVTK